RARRGVVVGRQDPVRRAPGGDPCGYGGRRGLLRRRVAAYVVKRRVRRPASPRGEHLRRVFDGGLGRRRGLPQRGAPGTGVEGESVRRVTMIGGGGIRTPLVIHALARAQAALRIGQVALFDIDSERTETLARLGREIVRQLDGGFEIRVCT